MIHLNAPTTTSHCPRPFVSGEDRLNPENIPEIFVSVTAGAILHAPAHAATLHTRAIREEVQEAMRVMTRQLAGLGDRIDAVCDPMARLGNAMAARFNQVDAKLAGIGAALR